MLQDMYRPGLEEIDHQQVQPCQQGKRSVLKTACIADGLRNISIISSTCNHSKVVVARPGSGNGILHVHYLL